MLRLFSAAVVALSTVAFGGTYEIDSSHAAANFSVRHLGVSNVTGTLGQVTGKVMLDDADASWLDSLMR